MNNVSLSLVARDGMSALGRSETVTYRPEVDSEEVMQSDCLSSERFHFEPSAPLRS